MVLYCVVIMATWMGCDSGDGGTECLQEPATNASAKVNGMAVELNGWGKMETVVAPTPTGPVWAEQLTLSLDINFVQCDHLLTLWVKNPGPGKGEFGNHIAPDGPSFTGMYAGELGTFKLTGESTLEITAYGSSASGTFKAVLEDGTVFSSGKFNGLPVH